MHVTLLLLLLTSPPDTADLTPRWKAQEETSTRIEVERAISSEGDALHGAAASTEKRLIVYGEKVDALDKGRPSSVRRKYARYETRFEAVFGGVDLGDSVEKHPIAGRVFTFVLRDGKLVPTDTVPAGDELEGPLLEANWGAMLPGRAVKAGESWSTDGTVALAKLTRVHAPARCTLRSVDAESGDATIAVKIDHTPGHGLQAVFSGTMVFSGRLGKVTRVELEGRTEERDERMAQTTRWKIRCERRVAAKKG
jgi:hypothetical protein